MDLLRQLLPHRDRNCRSNFYLTQSHCIGIWPTSPNADPLTPCRIATGVLIFKSVECLDLKKKNHPPKKQQQQQTNKQTKQNKTKTKNQNHGESGNRTEVCRSQGGRLNHWANEAVSSLEQRVQVSEVSMIKGRDNHLEQRRRVKTAVL